jgi:aspartate--ammonia ligase
MSKNQLTPKGYESILNLRETEKAIKLIKDFFEKKLSEKLNLQRVSAPRFVKKGTGINDDLNGKERKVSFNIKYNPKINAEIVFSLAKWKRMALKDYGFRIEEGLYTDMDAIRPDEEILDNLHSIYVDQWDWEKAIKKEDRNLDFLKNIVKKIYKTIKETEKMVSKKYPEIKPVLPEKITFLSTEDLMDKYLDLKPKEREDKITEKYGAVFLIGIGRDINGNIIHDERAPDYDDWTLNGDIIFWNPVIRKSFEISSMGIRVDRNALIRQLKITHNENRMGLEWHKRLLAGEFPESVGGGIGQSRLCMFLLRKAHIGEVQSSLWSDEIRDYCKKNNINLF